MNMSFGMNQLKGLTLKAKHKIKQNNLLKPTYSLPTNVLTYLLT
jgi:hypothetical protein